MTTIKRVMPKGVRRGGVIFPRLALADALGYARKLVSKTHTNEQPRDIIYSGVVGAKSGVGDVRMSALKQYGFLKGTDKLRYSADELAKQIVASPEEELAPLLRRAVLKPPVFRNLFDTFQGDTVTKAKLKQRAFDLKVHPDSAIKCIELYIQSMHTAGLVHVDGERIVHCAANDLADVEKLIEIDSAITDATTEAIGRENDNFNPVDENISTDMAEQNHLTSDFGTNANSPPRAISPCVRIDVASLESL